MKKLKQFYAAVQRVVAALAAVISTVINPLVVIVTSAWKVLNSIAQTTAETPANAAAAVSEHLSKKAEHFPEQLDEKDEQKKKKKLEQHSAAILRALFNTDSLMENRKLCRCTKVTLILLLQYSSLRTTYRGLAQCFTDPVIPILISFAIQIGVVVLSSIIGLRNTQKSKWVLMVMFLSASIFFSFIGVSERTLHYQSYIEHIYEQYANEYNTVKADTINAAEGSYDPLATIEGEYVLIDRLLEEGNRLFGSDAMNSAQQNVEFYNSKTVFQVVSQGSSIRILPDGQAVVVSNGDKMVPVPDPAVAESLAEAITQVKTIQSQQNRMDIISGLLNGDCALDKVKKTVSQQMASDTPLSDFVSLATSVSALTDPCNQLAQAIGSDIRVSLDLNGLVEQYRSAQISTQIRPIESFEGILVQWGAEENSLDLAGMEWLDAMLGTDTAHVPGRLKELADQEVSVSFHSLYLSLSLLHSDDALKRLEDAFAAYNVENPFTYAVTAILNPSSELFGGALMALGAALFTDLAALAVGLIMVNRPLDLTGSGSIPPVVLRKHMYESLLNAVKPILRVRLGQRTSVPTDEELSNTCIGIIADFLDEFALCPQLARTGYVRYLKGEPNREFSGLFTLLLGLGMIEHLNYADAVAIGLIPADSIDDGEDYLILNSRGDAWMMELLGSSDIFTLSNAMA